MMSLAVLLVVLGFGFEAFAGEDSITATGRPDMSELDGRLGPYLALALENSPKVNAAFHRYQAQRQQVARAKALPEPEVQLGVFLRAVETRTGPQQARISVRQAFPWPTRLTQSGRAATARADASEARLQAVSLAVAEQVQLAYWSLWELRQKRALHQQHLELLRGLSDTVRARMETGSATLADLQQSDLSGARLADQIASMDQEEVKLIATLQSALGVAADANTSWPTIGPARLASPKPTADELRDAAANHPLLASLELDASAALASAKAAGAGRLPRFTVGADWTLVGPAGMDDVPDSGKDAVMAGVGLTLPLWQRVYQHDVKAQRHTADALHAQEQDLGLRVSAEVTLVLAALGDSTRRQRTIRQTLLPQARAAYASVLGNYAVGEGSIAQAMLGQRDLLDLGVDQVTASADHARAWARLEQLVGLPIERTVEPQDIP